MTGIEEDDGHGGELHETPVNGDNLMGMSITQLVTSSSEMSSSTKRMYMATLLVSFFAFVILASVLIWLVNTIY